jgi:hypothetical protein
MARDTRTGEVLERMILPALESGGYTYRLGVNIGKRLGQTKHILDVLVRKNDQKFLVSLKWQQVSGTAEQKIPFEVISLSFAMQEGDYAGAYLVLGGDGWRLRDFYTAGGLDQHLRRPELVTIVTLERFVALANQGAL